MFMVLFSWFIGKQVQQISCTKTQKLPNLRLPIRSIDNKTKVTSLASRNSQFEVNKRNCTTKWDTLYWVSALPPDILPFSNDWRRIDDVRLYIPVQALEVDSNSKEIDMTVTGELAREYKVLREHFKELQGGPSGSTLPFVDIKYLQKLCYSIDSLY